MIIYIMEQEQFENNSEAQIVQKLKNNEPRPRFTGSYKKKACTTGVTPDYSPFLTLYR